MGKYLVQILIVMYIKQLHIDKVKIYMLIPSPIFVIAFINGVLMQLIIHLFVITMLQYFQEFTVLSVGIASQPYNPSTPVQFQQKSPC